MSLRGEEFPTMMQQMRANTKWIMLLAAAAFVALMVFEWGMDITGQSSGGAGEIGRVNGATVPYEAFQSTYRNLYDQVQASQEEPVTSQQNREIEDAAWDELVNQILIRQELGRRGIVVTDDEIRQAAQFSPPPGFRDNPAFQTDGQFDLARYQQYLATSADQLLLLQLEAYYRDIIPRSKLLRQVSSGIYVTDDELWQAWRDANESVAVSFFAMSPAQRIADGEVQISDAEIARYYQDNREDFAVPARATVQAVVIPKAPTPADTAASAARAVEVRQELLDGADFAEVAQRESADAASSGSGGELGQVARGAMLPALDSVVFSVDVGTLSEPVKTSFGWHLIEVTERAGDTAAVRHVLIPVERTEDSEIHLLTLADSLEALAEEMPLADAAAEVGLEVQTVDLTEDFPFLAGAGQAGEGIDWALDPEVLAGEVSPVFETRQAFYGLELVAVEPAGHLTLEQARTAILQTLRNERKIELAASRVEQALASLGPAASLEDIATELDTEVQVSAPFTRGDFVPGLGSQNGAIGAAFGLSAGQRSGIVRTRTDIVMLRLEERIPADRATWEAQKEDQRIQAQRTIGERRLQEWLEGLRENARIVDRRDDVLRADDEPLEEMPFSGRMGF